MGKNDELVKPETGSALKVPDYLDGLSGSDGLEDMGKEDMVLPRLSVCQSTTPQRKRSNPTFIQGLEDGQMFNTVTTEVYGDKLLVLPIKFSKSRILFRDMDAGGGMLCQSLNGINGGQMSPTCDACPKSKFHENAAPECTEYLNVALLVLPSMDLAAFSFKSTSLKVARKWVTRAKMFNKPLFTQVYSLATVPDKRGENDFFSPTVSFERWATERELAVSQQLYGGFKGKDIKIAEESQEERAAEREAGEDDEDAF